MGHKFHNTALLRWLSDATCNQTARLLLAVLLLAGTLALLLLNRPVPDALYAFDGAAIGFYFGGVSTNS